MLLRNFERKRVREEGDEAALAEEVRPYNDFFHVLDLSRFKELEELTFTNLHPRSFTQFPNAAQLRRLRLSYHVCVKAENMFLPILARFRAL